MSRSIKTVISQLTRVQPQKFVRINKNQAIEETENRWLTEMAMRHSRYDPSGSFTKINFDHLCVKNHACVKEDVKCNRACIEEDLYYTEMAKKFAKKN